MVEINNAADEENFTLCDVLEHYRKQVKFDAEAKQVLKKPRDQKSSRAKFIVLMKKYSNLSMSSIATVAAVMFEDEAIDERLVRRLTEARADFS
nr:hypothetical protein [Pseudomonas luteola]